jgi:hypothetical protein
MSTTSDIQELQIRVTLLEEMLNKVQVALTNTATLNQLRQILLIKQSELEDLRADYTSLKNRVDILQEEITSGG